MKASVPHRARLTTLFVACLIVSLHVASLTIAAEPAGPFRPTAQNEIVPTGGKVELLWNDGEFTEGPVAAVDGTILFTDIGTRIMRFDPSSGKTTVFRRQSGKANGLFFDAKGRLVACEGAAGGNRRISITGAGGKTHTLADRFDGKRFNSPNDLTINAKGQVYFTDPRYVGDEPRELDFEGVFLIDTDGTVKVATRELQKPNGILISADGRTVFVADNNGDPKGNHQLLAFAVKSDGTLRGKRLLFDFGPNRRGIDGMTLDVRGNIYATAGSGEEAGVYVFTPSGNPLAFVATPGAPTNCVFGTGAESHTLYITAAGPVIEGKPRRYALYRVKLEVAGYHLFPVEKK